MLSGRLKDLRSKKDMTQAELAETIGVSQQAVAKWEKNKAEPDHNTLMKLSEIFHVTTDYLLGRNAPPAASDRLLFDEREREHIKKYRAMTDEHREAVDAQIDFFYKKDAEARVKSGSVQAGRNFAG